MDSEISVDSRQENTVMRSRLILYPPPPMAIKHKTKELPIYSHIHLILFFDLPSFHLDLSMVQNSIDEQGCIFLFYLHCRLEEGSQPSNPSTSVISFMMNGLPIT